MPPEKTNFGFNSDRPIQCANQDLLGRSEFASLLARKISDWRDQESLVIALYGEWGSGKSSVKNLILEALGRHEERPVTPIEFNPWLVSGEEKITASFFDEIGAKLRPVDEDSDAKRRSRAWQKYARYFEYSSHLFGLLNIPATAAGVPILGLLAGGLKELKEMAKTTSEDLDKKEQEKSLQELRSELRQDFETLKVPILVVIDDIDRLTSEEICLIFRLVKANADFPNLIFLLLFQRETAEQALDKIAGNNGRLFLDKIVQVGINLPPSHADALRKVLFTGINEILQPLVDEAELENERFLDLWQPGLSHYFRNLREIYRFLSSFSFSVTAFYSNGVMEVNPVDLIAVEVLRIAEPEVYESIRNNKAGLVQDDISVRREEVRLAVADALLSQSRKPPLVLQSVLKNLFPKLKEIWDNARYSPQSLIWTSKRRICSERFFDRYFLLGVPPEQVSERLIGEILDARNDKEKLLRIFKDLLAKGLAIDALERLSGEELLMTLQDPVPYISALADLADDLPKQEVSLMQLHGDIYVHHALARIFRVMVDEAAKREIIASLIRESAGLAVTGDWLQRLEDPAQDDTMPRITSAECDDLKEVWLDKVRDAASSRRLLQAKKMYSILLRWGKWGDAEEPRVWASTILSDPGVAARLLCGLVTESSTSTFESYHVSDSSWIDWRTLATFCSFGEWRDLLQRLDLETDFSSEEQRAIKLFKMTMQKWSNDSGVDVDADTKVRL